MMGYFRDVIADFILGRATEGNVLATRPYRTDDLIFLQTTSGIKVFLSDPEYQLREGERVRIRARNGTVRSATYIPQGERK